jgi:hypothetical protein
MSESKKDAMRRAYDHANPEWRRAAAMTVRAVARRQERLTADDIMAAIPTNVSTHELRALGQVVLHAAKAGLIKKARGVDPVNCARDNCHGAPITVWESLIFNTTERTPKVSLHSAILGGSNAERLMRCPASYMEQMRSPAGDVESSYAAEGTALHEAAAELIKTKVRPVSMLGELFYDHEIDQGRVEVLENAIAHLHKILDAYGGVETFKVVGIEETLALPGVTGAFGSVDLSMASKDTVVVCDWKFGGGVAVKALYEDEQGEYLNPQLAFYTASARAKHARKFKGKRIVCAIIQPRILPGYTVAETTDKELDDFVKAFREAFLEALTRAPHRERGEWCRFATCKATCPLWTGPVLDLATIDPTRVALKESVKPDDYGAFLSRALHMADVAENWIVEIRRQGHVFLENGGAVPDFKLVPKRATRKWINPDVVEDVLSGCGAKPEDIWSEPTLRSVAQAETALKKRGISLPADLYHAVSSGTTIAPADDSRPDVSQAEVSKDLRQALAYLRADGDSARPQ